jgi:hypothetical protein
MEQKRIIEIERQKQLALANMESQKKKEFEE